MMIDLRSDTVTMPSKKMKDFIQSMSDVAVEQCLTGDETQKGLLDWFRLEIMEQIDYQLAERNK